MTKEQREQLYERWLILRKRRYKIYLLMMTGTTDKDYQRCMTIERELKDQEKMIIHVLSQDIKDSLLLNDK